MDPDIENIIRNDVRAMMELGLNTDFDKWYHAWLNFTDCIADPDCREEMIRILSDEIRKQRMRYLNRRNAQ